MAGQSKQGRPVDVFVVAFLAMVEVGRRRKLAAMDVLVAIRTERKLDLVQRGRARRKMTLGARNLRMRTMQGEAGRVVLYDREFRGFEAIQRVAGVAAAAIGTLGELSTVRIGVVAISARLMGDGSLEITGFVAGFTIHFQVLTQ